MMRFKILTTPYHLLFSLYTNTVNLAQFQKFFKLESSNTLMSKISYPLLYTFAIC